METETTEIRNGQPQPLSSTLKAFDRFVEGEPTQTYCAVCNADLGLNTWKNLICKECYSKREAEEWRQKKREQWAKLCPPLYRNFDKSRYPTESLESYEKIMAWQYNPKGLLIHGETRKGKSFAAYALLRRLLGEERNIKIYHSSMFGIQCQDAFLEGRAEGFVRSLIQPDVLFFDDLGHLKLTERIEEMLLTMVEERASHLKPIIITTNYTGSTLAERFTSDCGTAFIARLREFCDDITFA